MLLFNKAEKKPAVLVGIFLCIFLLIVWAVFSKWLMPLLWPHTSKSVIFLVSRITFWLYLLVMIGYAYTTERQPFLLWKDKNYATGYYIGSVLAVLAIIYLSSGVIYGIIKVCGFNNVSKIVQVLYHMSVAIKLTGVVTAAVVEELIFRGYLMPRLQLCLKNTYMPVIVSSLIFGLGHITYGTVINTVIPLLIGLVFGYHYQKYRNLKILIICHFIIDFNSLILVH